MAEIVAALDAAEIRVLGALIEKEITTPDYYPLTLNALTNACNQSSNRDPVVAFDESLVARTLDRLREKRLAYVTTGGLNRVAKYGQRLCEALELGPAERAILCELMVRGPQTVGELRGRASRMHLFVELAEVERALGELAARSPQPLVEKLPRQTGFKESRYAHRLGGAAEAVAETGAAPAAQPEGERLGRLEAETAALRRELKELREELESFRRQFQ